MAENVKKEETSLPEEEPQLDLSLKKKKKKAKAPVAAPTTEEKTLCDGVKDMKVDASEQEPSLSLPMKKKKKKPKATTEVEAEIEEEERDKDKEDEISAVTLPAKKKKKPKKPMIETEGEERDGAGPVGEEEDHHGAEEEVFHMESDGGEGSDGPSDPSLPWSGTDRDYSYPELLGRLYGILRDNNPELGGIKRRHNIQPPQIVREGTKKTVFINFPDICKTIHRSTDHVLAYMLTELGTSGSLDGNLRLVMKGRFQPKGIESILRRYISEYVTCYLCKSPDTNLKKENRLTFLHCESCGATRSVAAIRQGFLAQVGKRKLQRNKAT